MIVVSHEMQFARRVASKIFAMFDERSTIVEDSSTTSVEILSGIGRAHFSLAY